MSGTLPFVPRNGCFYTLSSVTATITGSVVTDKLFVDVEVTQP